MKEKILIIVAILIVFILVIFLSPALTGQSVTILPDNLKHLLSVKETQIPTQEAAFESREDWLSVSAAPTTLATYQSVLSQTPIPIPSSAQRRETEIAMATLLPEKPPTPQPTKASSIERETVPREIGRYTIDGEGMYIVQRVYPGNEDTRYSFAQVPKSRIIQSYAGKYSTITAPIEVDASYFIISYTVDVPEFVQNTQPSAEVGDKDTWAFEKMYSPVTTKSNNNDEKVKVESYAVDTPRFSITIIDAKTGNIVQTITQMNLDSRMWAGVFGEQENADDDENINWDPRPWRENVFAGEGEYLFDIQTNALNSYQVDILVPIPEPVKKETEPLLLALFIQRELRNLVSFFKYENRAPAYNYFTAIAKAHVVDEEMGAVIERQITDLKQTGAIVSTYTITDAELYGSSPVLRGTLTIDKAIRGEDEDEESRTVFWSIAIDSIPTSRSIYQGTIKWEIEDEVYQTAWRYPAEIIRNILMLEDEYTREYGNNAIFYRDASLFETHSSDLILLSAVKDQGIDMNSGVVPVYPEPYLIPFDIQKFIALYNADNFEWLAYGENISEALSKRINDTYTLDEIYQHFLAMRLVGITLQDFKIYSVDIRGTEASIRGEYIWSQGKGERRTPCEIIVVFEWTKANQYSMWKIDTLPPLRY